MFAVIFFTLTHTVSCVSVTEEAAGTGAGLSAERTKATRTAGYGTVRSSPSRQTLTVTVPVVACGVVGTVNTHLGALFAVVSSWTNLITVGPGVSWQAVTLSCHMVAAVRMATGGAGHAALLSIHTSFAFVLTGDSPVARAAHTRSSFPQARVAVGAMLVTGLVTVAPPQALGTRLIAARTPPPWQTATLPAGCLAAVIMDTITPLQAAWPKRAHRARLVAARPPPTGCAGTGSICRITFCPVGAMAGGVASWAPRPLRARGGAVRPPPALFAEASPVSCRAVNKVFTGALQGAVLAIDATLTWTLTVNPRIPGGTVAFSSGAITHPSIHTQTRLQAAMTVETVSARLITEESCPAWLTCAFSFHGVAAESVFLLAEARALTVHAVCSGCAHPVPAVWTAEARLTQAGSIDVVAARPVSTVTHTLTVLPVGACSTLLITPVTSETLSTLALSSFRVTLAPVVAETLIGAVLSEPSL